MNRIPRRLFTTEFKREAIKLVTAKNLSLAEAGRKLDVATKSLRVWIAQSEGVNLKRRLVLANSQPTNNVFENWNENSPLPRWSATS